MRFSNQELIKLGLVYQENTFIKGFSTKPGKSVDVIRRALGKRDIYKSLERCNSIKNKTLVITDFTLANHYRQHNSARGDLAIWASFFDADNPFVVYVWVNNKLTLVENIDALKFYLPFIDTPVKPQAILKAMANIQIPATQVLIIDTQKANDIAYEKKVLDSNFIDLNLLATEDTSVPLFISSLPANTTFNAKVAASSSSLLTHFIGKSVLNELELWLAVEPHSNSLALMDTDRLANSLSYAAYNDYILIKTYPVEDKAAQKSLALALCQFINWIKLNEEQEESRTGWDALYNKEADLFISMLKQVQHITIYSKTTKLYLYDFFSWMSHVENLQSLYLANTFQDMSDDNEENVSSYPIVFPRLKSFTYTFALADDKEWSLSQFIDHIVSSAPLLETLNVSHYHIGCREYLTQPTKLRQLTIQSTVETQNNEYLAFEQFECPALVHLTIGNTYGVSSGQTPAPALILAKSPDLEHLTVHGDFLLGEEDTTPGMFGVELKKLKSLHLRDCVVRSVYLIELLASPLSLYLAYAQLIFMV